MARKILVVSDRRKRSIPHPGPGLCREYAGHRREPSSNSQFKRLNVFVKSRLTCRLRNDRHLGIGCTFQRQNPGQIDSARTATMLRNIRISLWGLIAGLTVLWLLANLPFPDDLTVITLRNLLVQYSGVIGISVMSVALILAVRPVWLEPWLGGLDKSYRLHKWLGIAGLVAAIFHWVASNVPEWAVSLGVLAAPERRAPPAGGATVDIVTIESVLNGLRGTAEGLGEKAFYVAVLLIALALIRRFPYRLFAKTHLFIAVAYLVLVFHSVVLLDFSAWMLPLGIATGLLMLAGTVSAVLVLTRQVGKRRKVAGTVEEQHLFKDMNVLETTIRLDDGWTGHKSGQFAFVTFDQSEGAHPFTIASAWDASDPRIMFITKGLGDYTDDMPERVRVGSQAIVEGPYGGFTFEDTAARQIWIGGGIGITPFIARMKHLAKNAGSQTVDLFHTTPRLAPEAREKLTADAKAAGIRLHVMVDDEDGLLTGERLRAAVPDWQSASVWFCGPAAFAKTLRRDLAAHGMACAAFHQELFNMR
ncbi:ferredoxin reductase family protein [Thalassococcus arenae]|nr:ferric reductase-like transmembrane domain-containing protein [Thalassococcus arenae]